VSVRVGFAPSYRFLSTPWCQKMRDDSLAAFAEAAGLEVVVPQPAPDGVWVDALILCPLDFDDERSAAKIAERLQVPVLLYATKERP
jgi:hypothetical protein